MARPLVALVGCGSWGRYILRDLRQLGCEVAVVARSEESRRRARQGGAATIVRSIEELPAVAGMVVATPTVTHAAVLDECLALGLPLFVEKPLTCDPIAASRLARGAAGERLFVMDKWRYHPGVEALAELGRSSELGPVVGVRTTRLGWGHPHSDVDPLWILAPHDLAIGLEILGAVPPVRDAVADRIGGEPFGLVALLGRRPWLALDLAASAPLRRRSVQLVCEEGTAWLPDGYAEHVAVARAGGIGDEPELRPISTEFPLLRELRAFIEHLEGGPAPRSSATEAAEMVQRIAELRSAAEIDAPMAVGA